MKSESKELSKYIKSVLEGIDDGLIEGYVLKDSIKFEVAVVNIKNKEGGLVIHVVKAGAVYSKEEITKIKFEVTKKGEYTKPRSVKIKKWDIT